MGNLIFGTIRIDGRKFDDIKIQTSKAGVPRPIVFGTVRPITGNIIATTEPEIRKRTERIDNGWLAPDTKITHEEVFRTYAIRICEGPVTGITRVWRNNELVYDRDSSNSTQIQNNNAFLEKAEFFLGGFDQMPSSVMQAAFGINNVHGYRGTCYMVVDDENLTATGGAIPQYAFEVERCEGFVLTSMVYAIEAIESINLAPGLRGVRPRAVAENIDISPSVQSIFLNPTIIFSEYEAEPEIIDISPSIESIQLDSTIIFSEYEAEPEIIDISPSVESIFLNTVIGFVEYDVDTESIDIEPNILFINLSGT